MYVIVGLGNPGLRYRKTRHNTGFRVVDELASKIGVKLSTRKFKALVGEGFICAEKVLLVKPQTYMNRSGDAVYSIASYYDADFEKVIVIYDDIDIPLGSIRIRKSGSAGTHNGMKDIVKKLGSKEFPRVRVGIGSSEDALVDHVIGKVPKDEQKAMKLVESITADAVIEMVSEGIDAAMNKYNTKKNKDSASDDD